MGYDPFTRTLSHVTTIMVLGINLIRGVDFIECITLYYKYTVYLIRSAINGVHDARSIG